MEKRLKTYYYNEETVLQNCLFSFLHKKKAIFNAEYNETSKNTLYNMKSIKWDGGDMEESNYLKNKLYFSMENLYGFFKIKEDIDGFSNNSSDYDLDVLYPHDNLLPRDLFKRIAFLHKTAAINLRVYNVLCIKINGLLKTYRFTGFKTKDPESFYDNFLEIKNFTNKESESILDQLHAANKVVSAMDGRIYSVDDIMNNNQELYALDDEIFKNKNSLFDVTSNFTLYHLSARTSYEVIEIEQDNFNVLQNALYYFFKAKQKDPTALLLLNKRELELVNLKLELAAACV